MDNCLAMRTTPFQAIFNQMVRLHGRDPRKEIPSDMRDAIVDHINDRVRTIWQGWRWPEWEITEERAFRQVWNAAHQYMRVNPGTGQPDEVFYLGSGFVTASGSFGANFGYYRVIASAANDPPIGTVPTNPAYFAALSPVDTFIEYDQPCKRAIGIVRGIYSRNPRSPTCHSDGGLRYTPSEKGVDVCCSGNPTVFLTHTLPCPSYTMTPYVVGKTYVRGNVVFDPSTGECFQAFMSTILVPSDTSAWNWVPFLDVWSDYCSKGAFADSLMEFDQGGNGELQAKMVLNQYWNQQADDSLQAEVDALTTQGQKLQWNFCRKTSCVCESESWSGATLVTIS